MVGVVPIHDKLRENRLQRFGHIYRRPANVVVKKSAMIVMDSRLREEEDLN